MKTVTLWQNGERRTVPADEFLQTYEAGSLPSGTYVALPGATQFSEPRDAAALLRYDQEMTRIQAAEVVPTPQAPPRLAPCPACGHEVSTQALACPKCGQPISAPQIQGSGGNVAAALASFFFPGLGQLVQGRIFEGIGFFFASLALWFIFLGWIMHIIAAVDAASWNPPRNR